MVRLAALEDAEAIAEIQNAVNADRASRKGRSNTARIRTAGPIRDGLLKLGSNPLENSFVACQEGRVVGSLYVSQKSPNFWRKDAWIEPTAPALCIFGLNIHPHDQSKGFGRALMSHVEAVAREHDIPFVRLDTYPHWTRAYGFYKSLGYIERTQIDLNGTALALFEKSLVEFTVELSR